MDKIVLVDGVAGVLSTSVAQDDEILKSSEFKNLPEISNGERATVTIFERSFGGKIDEYEIVHVTQHDADSDKATVERAQEGTEKRNWDSGSLWSHGLTSQTLYDYIHQVLSSGFKMESEDGTLWEVTVSNDGDLEVNDVD